jgi:hypothetical protein
MDEGLVRVCVRGVMTWWMVMMGGVKVEGE